MIAATVVAALFGLTTVDERVQAAAERAGADAVVVLDAHSGQVIARAGHIDRPLPPGSTFKLVTVLAAAAARPDALAGSVRCNGLARIGTSDVHCWLPSGHGELELEEAIPQSCNIYFATVGERVGTAALIATARALGVGTGRGRLPPASAPAAKVADGDGVLTTALELAQLTRQIATGRRDGGGPLASPAVLGRLRRGMRAAVEHGTARGASASLPVAGKTGSAAAGSGEVGWFIGYAPADDPSVVIAIAKRHALGHDVAYLAPPILEAFFHGGAPPPAR